MCCTFPGAVAWQGRYCALSYNSFSSFVKHVYSQVSRVPCDVTDCSLCTAESHQDFDHVNERLTMEMNEFSLSKGENTASALRQNFFPAFDSSTRSKKDIKKRMRPRQRGASSTSASTEKSPRLLALQHHAKSTTPRFDNPYEEVYIQDLFTGRGKKSAKNSSALFPYIPQSPPSRSRQVRVNVATGKPAGNRRTISAPGVETHSLRTLLTK